MFVGLDNATSISLLSAFFANPINLERMASGDVVVLASNLLLDLSDFLREKFHRGATLGTDHVVMTAPVVLVLVARNAVVKSDFAGQPATRQQFQRPVNGGDADARVVFLDQAVQFVDGKMLPGFEKCPQNGIALLGLLQADALEVLQEYSFRFADVLPRDGRLIVDSFLQHGVRHEKSCKSGPLQNAFMILARRRLSQLEGEGRIAAAGSILLPQRVVDCQDSLDFNRLAVAGRGLVAPLLKSTYARMFEVWS